MFSAAMMALVLTNCGCFDGHFKLRWHPVPCVCTRHGMLVTLGPVVLKTTVAHWVVLAA